MPTLIFYSWQSDRPDRVNHRFIRRALDLAVERINADLPVEEAARVDQDTQGVPGSPPIADVILTKIDSCGIFVPDLTFVGVGEAGRLIPNPNVMLEYGYALKSVGDRRILAVFNAAFGEPKQLPFDIGHKRWPIIYIAKPGENSKTLDAECLRLSTELEKQLRVVLESGTASTITRSFPIAEPKDGPASFLEPNEPITPHRERSGGTRPSLWLKPGPKLFMRLIPTSQTEPLSNTEVRHIVSAVPLIPPSSIRAGGFSYGRNKYGSFSYDAGTDDLSIASSITQLFKSRELWAIDTRVLDQERTGNPNKLDFPVLATGLLEDICNGVLSNFIKAARDHLGLVPPLRLIVGLVGVTGFRLAVPFEKFHSHYEGYIHEDPFKWETTVMGYNEKPSITLRGFYNHVWDVAGLSRPVAKD